MRLHILDVQHNNGNLQLYERACLPVQEVWGYQLCLWKLVLVGVGAVCSGGLLLLLLYWLPEWGVKGTCTPSSLREAHTLLLRTTVGTRWQQRLEPGASVITLRKLRAG